MSNGEDIVPVWVKINLYQNQEDQRPIGTLELRRYVRKGNKEKLHHTYWRKATLLESDLYYMGIKQISFPTL